MTWRELLTASDATLMRVMLQGMVTVAIWVTLFWTLVAVKFGLEIQLMRLGWTQRMLLWWHGFGLPLMVRWRRARRNGKPLPRPRRSTRHSRGRSSGRI